MLVEEGDDFFRMPFEVIVTVPEALLGVLDPQQFLTSQQIEGFLRVLGVPRPFVLEDGHLHLGGRELRSHFSGHESAHLEQLEIDEFLILADALELRNG
jgi:hypothetical protein